MSTKKGFFISLLVIMGLLFTALPIGKVGAQLNEITVTDAAGLGAAISSTSPVYDVIHLGANITIDADTGWNYYPTFTKTFDGHDYTINYNYAGTVAPTFAIFYLTNGATIRNLNLVVNTTGLYAPLVYNATNTTFKNINVSGTMGGSTGTTEARLSGLVQFTLGFANFENITSSVVFNLPAMTTMHAGGIAGTVNGRWDENNWPNEGGVYAAYFNNCAYTGTINTTFDSGVATNYLWLGGMIAATQYQPGTPVTRYYGVKFENSSSSATYNYTGTVPSSTLTQYNYIKDGVQYVGDADTKVMTETVPFGRIHRNVYVNYVNGTITRQSLGYYGLDGSGTDAGTIDWISCTDDCYVDPTGNDTNLGYADAPFATIQKAVDTVIAGGTVHVAAGTYAEQVTITKSLDLIGVGEGSTTVLAPAVRTGSVTQSSNVHDYLLAAYATSGTIDVRVEGFTLDVNTQNKTAGTARLDGVFFRDVKDAGGTMAGLFASTIHNFAATPDYESWGLAVYGDSLLTVDDNNISDHTRDGLLVIGGNVTISNNTVTGSATPLNGINIQDVMAGAVTGNTVSGHTRSASWAGVGIVAWTSSGLTISDNHVDGNFYGIDLADGSYGITISGNELTENISRGITLDDSDNNVVSGNTVTGPVAGTDDVCISLTNTSTGNMIDGNTVTMATSDSWSSPPNLYAIWLDGGVGAGSNTIQYNTITGGKRGIQLDGGNTGTTIIANNTISNTPPGGDNPIFGISINGGGATITSNTIANTLRPIEAQSGALNLTITGNTLSGSNFFGVNLGGYTGNPVVTGNKFLDFGGNGNVVWNQGSGAVDATLNWWGDIDPSDNVNNSGSGTLDYSPWCGDAACSFKIWQVAPLMTIQSVINAASAGDTIVIEGGTYLGGLIIDKDNLTINLNGATIGVGSPAFTIAGDDITINGPGKLLGNDGSAGVLVQAGADNFILDGVEITGWTDGVNVAGDVESLKIVNNWIHTNSESALEVVGTPTGVVTIKGNLFKANTGVAVVYGGSGTLDVTYNSWGALTGPSGLAGNVGATSFNYYELFFDMDAVTSAEDTLRRVAVSQTFDVALKADAVNVNSLSFKFSYDATELVLNLETFAAPWFEKCTVIGTPPAGTVEYFCLLDTGADWDGGEIATFSFTAIGSAVESFFDIFTETPITMAPLTPTAGAVGGVKVWVNNAGYNAPSATARDITDDNDGELVIDAIAQFTGFVDLQSRPNDSGAVLLVYDAGSGGVLKATATSLSSGKYTTTYETGMWMVVSTVSPAYNVPYYLLVDRALFLPTALTEQSLTDTPLTTLAQLLLLGGDANNDNIIGVTDAGCIGGAYGEPGGVCGIDGLDDVNEDGIVNIYDLALMGGNYGLSQSPW